MGWSGGYEVFDPTARALIDAGVSERVLETVLGVLVDALQDHGWDTEDASLGLFIDHPGIVAAFAAHGITQEDEGDEE